MLQANDSSKGTILSQVFPEIYGLYSSEPIIAIDEYFWSRIAKKFVEMIVLDIEIQVLQRLNASSNIWLKKQSEGQLEIERKIL